MGKYIGRGHQYGVFEKQVLTNDTDGVKTTFDLYTGVPSATGILVVYQGTLLEPNQDYNIVQGGVSGSRLALNFTPPDLDSGAGDSFYVIFLGRELQTASPVNNYPIYNNFVNNPQTDTFTITFPPPMQSYPLNDQGLIVYLDGNIQRLGEHWNLTTVSTYNDSIQFVSTPALNAKIDVYVHSVERSDISTPDFSGVWRDHLQNGSVWPEKLYMIYTDYKNGRPFPNETTNYFKNNIQTFGGMNIVVDQVYEAEYMDVGTVIKLACNFDCTLSGTPDNKIRIPLPIDDTIIKSIKGTTNLAGTVILSTSTGMELGIPRWGGDNAIDIYRNLAVNYSLESWSVQLQLEYKTDLGQ